jgi:hypothetical protein
MRACIAGCGDVPAVLSPGIQTANDLRTVETTQPGPTGVQIEALLGLCLRGEDKRMQPGTAGLYPCHSAGVQMITTLRRGADHV